VPQADPGATPTANVLIACKPARWAPTTPSGREHGPSREQAVRRAGLAYCCAGSRCRRQHAARTPVSRETVVAGEFASQGAAGRRSRPGRSSRSRTGRESGVAHVDPHGPARRRPAPDGEAARPRTPGPDRWRVARGRLRRRLPWGEGHGALAPMAAPACMGAPARTGSESIDRAPLVKWPGRAGAARQAWLARETGVRTDTDPAATALTHLFGVSHDAACSRLAVAACRSVEGHVSRETAPSANHSARPAIPVAERVPGAEQRHGEREAGSAGSGGPRGPAQAAGTAAGGGRRREPPRLLSRQGGAHRPSASPSSRPGSRPAVRCS
jgi:hypothetical protein